MIPELGQLALIVALLLALVSGVLPVIGAARGMRGWMKSAWPLARAQFVFLTIAFGCLAASFVGNDFSVAYVAGNSSSMLPRAYRFAAAWSGRDGALLLWALLLTLWMTVVSFSARALPDPMIARVLGVMSWVDAGFLLLLLFASNPFRRLLPPAMDGHDLSPLLRDPGMASFPPILYLGYTGFAVAFSFAIAAFLSGVPGGMWIRGSRHWTTAAWAFLTAGVVLDCGWTYCQLGWGGWWFWDPLENASFAPWLAGTALMHSQRAAEKRGGSGTGTMLLAVCAFLLSLPGTFPVYVSAVASIGARATGPMQGVFMVVCLSIVAVWFAWQASGRRLRIAFAGVPGVPGESPALSNDSQSSGAAVPIGIKPLPDVPWTDSVPMAPRAMLVASERRYRPVRSAKVTRGNRRAVPVPDKRLTREHVVAPGVDRTRIGETRP